MSLLGFSMQFTKLQRAAPITDTIQTSYPSSGVPECNFIADELASWIQQHSTLLYHLSHGASMSRKTVYS
jgi:hypothetical protein